MDYKIEDFSNLYNSLLNENSTKPKFHVCINQSLNVDGSPIEVIIYPQREPPKNDKLEYESVRVSMQMFVKTTNTDDNFDFIDCIAKRILGVKRGSFISNDKSLCYASFIDYAIPRNQPVINQGEYYTVFNLEGTVFVSASDGPVISNETEICLSLGPAINLTTIFGTPVPVSACEWSHGVSAEALPIGNNFNPALEPTADNRLISLSFVLCDRTFDKHIAQLIRGENGWRGWTYINYIYLTQKDAFTYTPLRAIDVHKCKYISGKITQEMGSFAVCDLVLQESD